MPLKFETWSERGAKDATQRANEIYRRAVEDFQPPPLAQDRLEEIDAFIAKRSEQGGADISK